MQQTATITKNIQDFGQKIGGAKKDLAGRTLEHLSHITDEALILQPLSKSFPRPDFARMSREGLMSDECAVQLQYLYNSIPAKPRSREYRIKKWALQVMPVIINISLGLENHELIDGLDVFTQQDYLYFAKEMEVANWPKEDYNISPFRIVYPYAYSSSQSFIVAKGNYIQHRSLNIEECVKWAKENSGSSNKKKATLQCSVYSSRANNNYYITPKSKTGIVLKTFDTKEEAFAFCRNNLEELERIYKELRTIPDERRDWNRPRSGTDYRNNADVSPEMFSSVFPFRGVEFGNWVTQLERSASLNEAYDALYDLADVLGVSPETLTLGNQLALAFGARGSGKALAHYERLKTVINLTKKKGAGSLAHEWFHALDNNLCIRYGQSLLMATENPDSVSDDGISGAILRLQAAIKASGFYKRSEKIDELKSKPYWATMVELTARAFEKYIITRLTGKGQVNDYLANIKTSEEYMRSDVYPYPTDEEIKLIAPHYDALFRQIFQTVPDEMKQSA